MRRAAVAFLVNACWRQPIQFKPISIEQRVVTEENPHNAWDEKELEEIFTETDNRN
jgi:hypothetical protein